MVESDTMDAELKVLYEKIKRLSSDRNKAERLAARVTQSLQAVIAERDNYKNLWAEAMEKLGTPLPDVSLPLGPEKYW